MNRSFRILATSPASSMSRSSPSNFVRIDGSSFNACEISTLSSGRSARIRRMSCLSPEGAPRFPACGFPLRNALSVAFQGARASRPCVALAWLRGSDFKRSGRPPPLAFSPLAEPPAFPCPAPAARAPRLSCPCGFSPALAASCPWGFLSSCCRPPDAAFLPPLLLREDESFVPEPDFADCPPGCWLPRGL